MDRSYLSEVENGHKNISFLALMRLAEALATPLPHLLKNL